MKNLNKDIRPLTISPACVSAAEFGSGEVALIAAKGMIVVHENEMSATQLLQTIQNLTAYKEELFEQLLTHYDNYVAEFGVYEDEECDDCEDCDGDCDNCDCACECDDCDAPEETQHENNGFVVNVFLENKDEPKNYIASNGEAMHLPSSVLESAGIPLDAAITVSVDQETGTIHITEKSDMIAPDELHPKLLQDLLAEGVCFATFGDMLDENEIAYE